MGRQKLYRSSDSILFGVCGGIAEFIGWPKQTVRILWVVFTLMGLGILVYLILALIMPSDTDGFNLDNFRKE